MVASLDTASILNVLSAGFSFIGNGMLFIDGNIKGLGLSYSYSRNITNSEEFSIIIRLSDRFKRLSNQICVFGFASPPVIDRMPALWIFP
jgi:hypothetical protein